MIRGALEEYSALIVLLIQNFATSRRSRMEYLVGCFEHYRVKVWPMRALVRAGHDERIRDSGQGRGAWQGGGDGG